MLGEDSSHPQDAMCCGDWIVVPNVPDDRLFTICRVSGRYEYSPHSFIDAKTKDDEPDLGHIRPIEVLTPGGVAFDHPLVSGDLRRSFRCKSRLWSLNGHIPVLKAIVAAAKNGAVLREGLDPSIIVRRAVLPSVDRAIAHLASELAPILRTTLQGAEWEPIFQSALAPLFREVEVSRIGGPTEQGADIEVRIPNPFAADRPWVIAIQIKNYQGEISSDAAEQLEQAIIARQPETAQDEGPLAGGLVAVILASTEAKPTELLNTRLRQLSGKYGVQLSCVYGDQVMRALAKGFTTLGRV
jgi:hypothetical protein